MAAGHFYVEAQRLLDPQMLRVAAFGHTDKPPVRCFHFVYTITRDGAIERLSKRILPAAMNGCVTRCPNNWPLTTGH
jgi:hypothetical protein